MVPGDLDGALRGLLSAGASVGLYKLFLRRYMGFFSRVPVVRTF